MQHQETSMLLSEKVDIKRSRIISFAAMIKSASKDGKLLAKDTSVSLLTPLGTVTGKLFIPNIGTDKETLPIEMKINLHCLDSLNPFICSLEKSIKEEGLNPRPVNDTSMIIIEDAVLISSSGKRQTFKILNLFVDQIIGFTAGSFQNHSE